jgi:hypothetical protein
VKQSNPDCAFHPTLGSKFFSGGSVASSGDIYTTITISPSYTKEAILKMIDNLATTYVPLSTYYTTKEVKLTHED